MIVVDCHCLNESLLGSSCICILEFISRTFLIHAARDPSHHHGNHNLTLCRSRLQFVPAWARVQHFAAEVSGRKQKKKLSAQQGHQLLTNEGRRKWKRKRLHFLYSTLGTRKSITP